MAAAPLVSTVPEPGAWLASSAGLVESLGDGLGLDVSVGDGLGVTVGVGVGVTVGVTVGVGVGVGVGVHEGDGLGATLIGSTSGRKFPLDVPAEFRCGQKAPRALSGSGLLLE
jgi:hypothetical protein